MSAEMTSREHLRTLILAAVALVTVVVLAAGLSGLELQTPQSGRRANAPAQPQPTAEQTEEASSGQGTEGPPAGPLAAGSDPLFYILAVLTVATVICALLSPRIRRMAAVMVFLMLLYTLLLTLAGRFIFRPPATPTAEPAQPAAEAPLPAGPPQWLSLAIAFGLALFLLGVGLFVVQQLVQRSKALSPAASPLAELAAEAQVTLEEIRAGTDLRDAVTRCYVEMSRILREQHDIRRAAAMTAHEFAEQLEMAGLPGEDVSRITRLFERVRYGNQPPGPAEEAEASSCLEAIVRAAAALSAQPQPAKE
jgi:hypothetical protein